KCAINTNTSQPILVDIVGPGASPALAVYSLASPQNPALLIKQPTQTYTFLTDISFLGTVGYFSTSWFQTSGNSITGQFGNFLAYDFSNLYPAPLSVLSSGPGSGGNNLMPNALALNASNNGSYPNTAYIASTTATGSNTSGNAALDVVNISSPQNMQGVYQVTVSSAAIFTGFGYDNPLLLLAGNTTSVQNSSFSITGNLTLSTMNITDVERPSPITTINTGIPTSGTFVVQPFGSDVFALVNNPPYTDPTGPSSLVIVDASKASSPAVYPFATQFGMTDVAAAGNYLLVPNVNGLMIYSIQTP